MLTKALAQAKIEALLHSYQAAITRLDISEHDEQGDGNIEVFIELEYQSHGHSLYAHHSSLFSCIRGNHPVSHNTSLYSSDLLEPIGNTFKLFLAKLEGTLEKDQFSHDLHQEIKKFNHISELLLTLTPTRDVEVRQDYEKQQLKINLKNFSDEKILSIIKALNS